MSIELCPEPLYPERHRCSGRGNCTITHPTQCECMHPWFWTGRGDLVYGSPTCAVSVIAVRVLHSILLISAAYASYLGFRYYFDQLKVAKSDQSRRNRFTLLNRSVAWSFIIAAVGFVVYACYRIVYPEASMGTDIIATTIGTISAAAHSVLSCLFASQVIVLGYMQVNLSEDHRAKTFRMLIRYCSACFVIAAASISIFMSFPILNSEETFEVLVLLMFSINVLILFLNCFVYRILFKTIAKNIRTGARERADEPGLIKEVLKQLDAFTDLAFSSCFVLSAMIIIFASWKGLRQVAYAYFFPTHWITAMILQINGSSFLRNVFTGRRARASTRRPQLAIDSSNVRQIMSQPWTELC